jgi:NAD(P)-dependent dehydrogenase (short-subunit alcohol dehydrogenase family)
VAYPVGGPNSGEGKGHGERVADIGTEEFARVLVTNALGPMRVIEGLQDHVRADGVMSSGQGSIGEWPA